MCSLYFNFAYAPTRLKQKHDSYISLLLIKCHDNCLPWILQCVLVSGHDIHDLHTILMTAEKQGVNVYTHGEMMPAHGYPKLREYKVSYLWGDWLKLFLGNKFRIATDREKFLENNFFCRSGKFYLSQGNTERMWKVRKSRGNLEFS